MGTVHGRDVHFKAIHCSRELGKLSLYLKTLKEMFPYFAAVGHILNAMSVHLHLQSMTNLKKHNPALYATFQDGLFVIRRSDHFWAGFAPDLAIEQALMRSIKSL